MAPLTGTVKACDPKTGVGSLVEQGELIEIDFADGALAASAFRFLRQGQTLTFDLNSKGEAVNLRFGSEPDMLTPNRAPGVGQS